MQAHTCHSFWWTMCICSFLARHLPAYSIFTHRDVGYWLSERVYTHGNITNWSQDGNSICGMCQYVWVNISANRYADTDWKMVKNEEISKQLLGKFWIFICYDELNLLTKMHLGCFHYLSVITISHLSIPVTKDQTEQFQNH